MKQSLQLKLGQNLTMTPQLQQAIRLLQLSTVELDAEVQDALDSNMLLERDEEHSGPTPEEIANNVPKDQGTDDAKQSNVDEAPEYAAGTQDDAGINEIPEELPVDSSWEDTYDTGPSFTASGFQDMEFMEQRDYEETLHDRLLWQLNLCTLSDTDKVIGMAIIDAIGDDGYLGLSLEDILISVDMSAHGAEEETELDEIEAVLRQIQNFEPMGVAARDLRECLFLQLRQLPADTPWLAKAIQLVSEYIDLLGSRDYKRLMRLLKLSELELQAVLSLVQTMNPRPGGEVDTAQIQYVIPDVFVSKQEGIWRIELNQEVMPKLRINAEYANMIKRADNSVDNNSLKSHMQEARWFIKSLQSRSETLQRVSVAIVERQRGFFEYGEEAMKPMVLADIATQLEMHESTISRVTTRKYMHTPRGIFELKFFFSSHVSTTMGGEASSTAIRAVIKKLIAAENTKKPLSDSKIATLLVEQGVKVARRTVAKYREAMRIPPSNERKRLI